MEQREIKFRAWDKKNKDMVYIEDLYWFEESGIHAFSGPDSWSVMGEFVFMQFTGIHDSNGKEVYEGDILATSNEDPQYDVWTKEDNGFTVVVWNKGYTCFQGSDWSWNDDEGSIYSMQFVEVIGNVYENSELIEVNNG